jgi:hypothetical protein
MKRYITLLSCLCWVVLLQAQREETLFNRTRLDLTGAWYTDSHNFTFLNNDSEYFGGGNVNLEFNRSVIIGWAWQRMRDYAPFANDQSSYRLEHRGLLLGYAPASQKVVHPYLSAVIGGGRINYDDNANITRDRIFVVQPALGIEVNVFRWFHLGVEGGYRLVSDVDNARLSNADVSRPFAQLQLRFGYSWGGTW